MFQSCSEQVTFTTLSKVPISVVLTVKYNILELSCGKSPTFHTLFTLSYSPCSATALTNSNDFGRMSLTFTLVALVPTP